MRAKVAFSLIVLGALLGWTALAGEEGRSDSSGPFVAGDDTASHLFVSTDGSLFARAGECDPAVSKQRKKDHPMRADKWATTDGRLRESLKKGRELADSYVDSIHMMSAMEKYQTRTGDLEGAEKTRQRLAELKKKYAQMNEMLPPGLELDSESAELWESEPPHEGRAFCFDGMLFHVFPAER